MKKKWICWVGNDFSHLRVRLVQRLPGVVLGLEGYAPHRLLGIREAPNTKGPGCGDRSEHGSTT